MATNMEKWYAVDASYGTVELHDILSWRQLQELFREIMMHGELRYIEIDETDMPRNSSRKG
jgi:hypothetical protein